MDNGNCKPKVKVGRIIVPAIPVFIFFLAWGFVVHHVWLMPIYKATATLWRTPEEMQELFPLMLGYQAALAVTIAAIYRKTHLYLWKYGPAPEEGAKKPCPIQRGVCFGVMIGLFMGVLCCGSYIWTPIPGELAIKWFISYMVQGMGAGVILSLMYNKKACKTS